MIRVLSLLLLMTPLSAMAEQSIFVKYEWNEDDYIVGVGGSKVFFENNHGFQAQAVASINYNEVLTTTGQFQDFYSLDTGLRMGYFSNVFLYVEAGVDVFDLVLHDLRYDDDYHYRYRDDHRDDVDGFAGLTLGFQADHVRISGFVKARQIDADTWESEHNIFYGAQLSLVF